MTPQRGEVWLVDLGIAAKIRPCVVISIPAGDEDRALVTIVPHTTALRGSRFEISIPAHFLRTGAFDVQNVLSIPNAKFIRCLGRLTVEQLGQIEQALKRWLGVEAAR